MNRRVVVTGTGVITPVGNDVNTYWKNLLEGVCGIDFIQSFPTDDLPVKTAISILSVWEFMWDQESEDSQPRSVRQKRYFQRDLNGFPHCLSRR